PRSILLPRSERNLNDALHKPRQVLQWKRPTQERAEQRIGRPGAGLQRAFGTLPICVAHLEAARRQLEPEEHPGLSKRVFWSFRRRELIATQHTQVTRLGAFPAFRSLATVVLVLEAKLRAPDDRQRGCNAPFRVDVVIQRSDDVS